MKIFTKLQKGALITFVIYCLVLIWVITFKCNMEFSIFMSKLSMGSMTLAERAEWSFCHFRFNGDGPVNTKDAVEDILVNISLFLPVGALLPMILKKKKFLKTPIIAFGMSLTFELVQFFSTIGGFTYIDLITNTLGAILGMIIVHFLLKVIKPEVASKILVAADAIFGVVAIFGIVNTINNIHIYL